MRTNLTSSFFIQMNQANLSVVLLVLNLSDLRTLRPAYEHLVAGESCERMLSLVHC
jgi:hypothetical protein